MTTLHSLTFKRAIATLALSGLAVAGLGACGASTGSVARSGSTTTVAPAAASTTNAGGPAVAPSMDQTDVGNGQANAPGDRPSGNQTAGQSGSQSGAGNPPAQPTTPSAKPVIDSFTTPDSIDCHNGMFQTFSASWSTHNSTKTTISIDGPGVYKTYQPSDQDSLPFNCSTSHTFLLTAYGADGSTVTKQITLQPRNVPGSEGTGDDAD